MHVTECLWGRCGVTLGAAAAAWLVCPMGLHGVCGMLLAWEVGTGGPCAQALLLHADVGDAAQAQAHADM
jgi:hypothetical protein